MAFKLSDVNGYGTGALGDVSNSTGQINSYANITAFNATTITIGMPSNGAYEKFVAGSEILIHVSAANGSEAIYLGKYLVCKITAVSSSVLTVDKDFTQVLPVAGLPSYQVQAITVAQFNTLALDSACKISPISYNASSKYGGILAFKCKNTLDFNGGTINLTDKGIPVGSTSLRPLTTQETTLKTTGFENHITQRQLLLNCGDGAAFIIAKKLDNSDGGNTTRIGGTTAGTVFFPYGNYDTGGDTTANSLTSVKGGSTILLVADTIIGFVPVIISKKRIDSGNGLGIGYGRCYIATNTLLPDDEGLYAQDCISDPSRLRNLGISNYGTGALGDITNPTGQINSYAKVTAITDTTITIGTPSNGVYEKFEVGTEIMFHISRNMDTDTNLFGKFFLTKIIGVNGLVLTIDKKVTDYINIFQLNAYKCQIVTIAQFKSLTVNSAYTGALTYSDSLGYGGILAFKVKGIFNLNDGKLNMEGKGIPTTVTRPYFAKQCNGQQKDTLPLSNTNGSVFFVANEMYSNSNSRIGATWDASSYGGDSGVQYSYSDYPGSGVGGGFTGSLGSAHGGVSKVSFPGGNPGLHSNFTRNGSSIFAVIDKLSFNGHVFSTGGHTISNGKPGGAGYGGGGNSGYYVDGGGGSYGGGGGSGNSATASTITAGGSGTCFIYCNTVTSADYTGVVL